MTWVLPECGLDLACSGGALASLTVPICGGDPGTVKPMTSAERRAYNQRKHAESRQELVAGRGPQGIAELWWDQARKIARDRAARGDQGAWNDLAMTLTNYCQRYSG